MGRYDGEDYASRPPCPEGQHQRAFNGSCYVCKILRERRDLRAENERLRELLYQALAEGGIPPADYAVSLNHDTGQAFLLFGSREARDA